LLLHYSSQTPFLVVSSSRTTLLFVHLTMDLRSASSLLVSARDRSAGSLAG
jgi:hypothetical protein